MPMLDQEKPVISSTRVCNFCETIEAPHILAKPTEKHAERRAEQRTDPAAVVLYVIATVFTHSKKKTVQRRDKHEYKRQTQHC